MRERVEGFIEGQRAGEAAFQASAGFSPPVRPVRLAVRVESRSQHQRRRNCETNLRHRGGDIASAEGLAAARSDAAVFFVFMIAICSPWGWRLQQPPVRHARPAAVVVGMVFVLYLVYREIVSLGQICPYCTSVHVITFLIFVLIVYEASAPRTAIPARARR